MNADGNQTLYVRCPYCGFNTPTAIDVLRVAMGEGWHIVNCDLDEGGCDKEFAMRVEVRYDARVYELKEPLRYMGENIVSLRPPRAGGA